MRRFGSKISFPQVTTHQMQADEERGFLVSARGDHNVKTFLRPTLALCMKITAD